MVWKVLIFAFIVVMQLISLRWLFRRAWGTDDFGTGMLFLILTWLFTVADAGAVAFEIVRHWHG